MYHEKRLYQIDIINKTINSNDSTLIQLPTGGGKTIIAKNIVIDLINHQNKKVLFLAPKIVLMEQTLEQFKGLKPQKVHANSKFDKNHNILISTLQTAYRRKNLSPDVIIIDEVHFGYEGKMLEQIFINYPKSRIIGLSATPYDENGYLLKGFDYVINDYNIKYMIKNNYLVPLRSFILVKPDLSNVDIIAGDYEQNQLSHAVSKNKVIMEIVNTSKPYIENSLKAIVFAVDINHAEILKVAFLEAGFVAEAIHSESDEEDNIVIERFKRGYIKVLVSVLKLTTGFDVPETDLAIIARPTKSQNLYKQMVGRVLRKSDNTNKKYAVLLDCGNVIENLGKPLEEIQPREELEKNIQKLICKKCKSEHIKLRKKQNEMYWECLDCGFTKYIEKKIFQCENCDKKHGYDSNFELVNNDLYLNCECGYETKISEATGDEEFREVDSGIEIDGNEKFVSCRFIAMKASVTTKTVFNYLEKLHNIKLVDPNSRIPESIGNKVLENILNKVSLFDNDSKTNFLPFKEARDFVRTLNLESKQEWKKYSTNQLNGYEPKPDNIPSNPHIIYANKGWINTDDWIGVTKSTKFEKYIEFEKAKKYIHELQLKSIKEWNDFKHSEDFPTNIPKYPETYYKNHGWKNMVDWLGLKRTTKIAKIVKSKYLPFNEAIHYVRKLNLKNEKTWINITKGRNFPTNIPKKPDEFYKHTGWVSWENWLGITK